MKTKNIIRPIALLCFLCAVSGCMSMEKTLRLTQEIGGHGTLKINTPLGRADVTLKNARQEDGMFKADEIDLDLTIRWAGRIEIEATEYSRPIIEK